MGEHNYNRIAYNISLNDLNVHIHYKTLCETNRPSKDIMG